MCFKFGGYLIPILPEKNFLTKINLENEKFKEARKKDLVEFIEDILTHKKLRYSEDLKAFLFDTEKVYFFTIINRSSPLLFLKKNRANY